MLHPLEPFRVWEQRRTVVTASPSSLDAAADPDVSVIIPAFMGRSTIVPCLESVHQAGAGRRVDVVVVESSGDGTAELVRARFPEVQVIESATRLSAGEARNVGLRQARGRFRLCVDQDCLVPPDWIERMTNLLLQPGVGAAGGSIGVANPGNLSGWCVYFLEFLTHFPTRGGTRDDNFLIGANSAWRAEVVNACSFPDQTLGEDLLFSEAVRARGFTVLYDPTITVLHHNRSGWREFLRYCRAMGTAAARSRSHLGGRAIAVLQRFPLLAFGIPLIMLPRIGWRLCGAPRGYLTRYLALLPCCVVGQFVWADAFRRALRQPRAWVRAER